MSEEQANIAGTDSATEFDFNLLIAPAFVLLGVIISQSITLITDRRRRTAEQLKEARTSAEELLKTLQEYRDLVLATTSVMKSDPTGTERDEWNRVSASAERAAAVLPSRGGHRKILDRIIEGLTHAKGLADYDQGLTSTLHRDYWFMADMGYQTVAAWLRYEKVPRRVRRHAARLRRNLYWYRLEWQSLHTRQTTGEEPKSGLVRRIWRASLRWIREDTKADRADVKAAIGYLFRA